MASKPVLPTKSYITNNSGLARMIDKALFVLVPTDRKIRQYWSEGRESGISTGKFYSDRRSATSMYDACSTESFVIASALLREDRSRVHW